ncbi:MAG: diacylglycerol/lipid kinase family protein [Aeromicrobium sp.]
MTAFHLIVNPASGAGAASAQGIAVARLLREAGAEATLTYSNGVQHSREVARESAWRGEVVVAVGGDGMVRSVVGAVVEAGGILGISPGGRGNDFARQLGLPTNAEDIAATLLAGRTRKVDVIDAGGEIVVGSVYAGVDSLASEIVNKSRFVPGRLQYQYAAVRALLTCRRTAYTLTIDGESRTFDAFTVIVANSGYYGSGMHVAPDALVDDGILDIVVLGGKSRFTLLKSMPKVYDGSHVALEAVTVLRGSTVRIEGAGVTAYADGDRLAELPIEATVRAGAVTILA